MNNSGELLSSVRTYNHQAIMLQLPIEAVSKIWLFWEDGYPLTIVRAGFVSRTSSVRSVYKDDNLILSAPISAI
jgi:hypothetical protein